MPEGLKDLMCDISREVLRAQPTNLFQFITDYLSALLVTRENLAVASRVCNDVCSCGCYPELEEELRNLGLNEEDVATSTEIVMKHFNNGKVHEANILMKIIRRTEINQKQLPDVRKAIRKAFMRHQANHTTIYESSSDSDKDETERAASHTLKLYLKTKPHEAQYNAMAQKMQASYKAYGVRRYCGLNQSEIYEPGNTVEKSENLIISGASTSRTTSTEERGIHELSRVPGPRLYTLSSTSLAGSHVDLPMYIPYSAHDIEPLSDLEEIPEKEHAHINYTDEDPHISIIFDDIVEKQRRISFGREDVTVFDDYESVSTEEVIQNDGEDEKTTTSEVIEETNEVYDENLIAVDEDKEIIAEEIVNVNVDNTTVDNTNLHGSSRNLDYDDDPVIDDVSNYSNHECVASEDSDHNINDGGLWWMD